LPDGSGDDTDLSEFKRANAALVWKPLSGVTRAPSDLCATGWIAWREVDRLDLTFASSGVRCAAWLYVPDGHRPRPAVVMAHGFAGTRRDRLDAYAERFAADGLAVLLFDYRSFGESEGEPRQVLDIAGQQADYRAALAFVRRRPEVDPARVALWGTSFSGGHVVALAASDPSIAAAVAQTPMADGLAQVRAQPPAVAARSTVLAVRDEVAARRGRAPVTMPVVGRPGAVAGLTSPDSVDGYASILGSPSHFRDEFSARVLLRVGLFRPVRQAARVRCPLLVCVADDDDLTPPAPAIRMAERAPRGELRRYRLTHFSIYTGAGFEQAVADQSDFLRRHLEAP
jgi:dienelactone hydrolase